MKALILNSGSGTRLGSITRKKPKCMVELSSGTSILSNQIDILLAAGIREIIITTGPFRIMLEEYIAGRYSDVNIKYIWNHEYRSTNYIYSIFLAKDFIVDNILLLHGDIVTEQAVIEEIIRDKTSNLAVVDENIEQNKKDFKARLENGYITEIGVDVTGSDCVPVFPVYKIKAPSFQLWLKKIIQYVNRGEKSVYAEDALNDILHEVKLFPLGLRGKLCMEVDTEEDLLQARKLFKKVKNGSNYF